MAPSLSAIICTHHRYPVLAHAIASLLAQGLDAGGFEIIVVDNSPDQAQAARFGAAYQNIANLRYLCEPVVGLAHARNVGIAQAAARIVAFIDDDAIAAPGWAQAILDGFAQNGARLGALGGPVRPRWPGPRPRWLGDDLLFYLGLVDWGNTRHEITPGRGLVGCNMALDKQLVLDLGGFSNNLGRKGDDSILLSGEEAALLARIEASGRSICYTPDAAVEHVIDPERLTQRWFRRRAAWEAVSNCVIDPAQAMVSAAACHAQLRAARTPEAYAAFDAPLDDPGEFSAAVRAVYCATLVALSGGALPLEETGSARRAWRNAALRGGVFTALARRSYTAGLARLGLKTYRRFLKRRAG